MNVMSKGGVEVCIPCGVATWHWCDLTFIESFSSETGLWEGVYNRLK